MFDVFDRVVWRVIATVAVILLVQAIAVNCTGAARCSTESR